MPKILRLDNEESAMQIEADLQSFKATHHKEFQDWQLMLIQTPHRSYSGEEDPILVVNEHGEVLPIGDYSFMINAISDKLEHVLFLAVDEMIAEDARVKGLD